MRIANTLRTIAEATAQASRWHPTSDRYQAEAAVAGRAYTRASSQGEPFRQLPRHARARRTVEQALEVAEECLSALVGTVGAETLVYRANALRRASDRVSTLADPGGQTVQGGNEVVVGEGAPTERPDVLHALFPGPAGELVQRDASDQT
jgi:hypothetical protein